MTTLAIVKKKGLAAIAADTAGNQGTCTVPSEYKAKPTKIVHVAQSFVASAGSSAHVRVLASLARRHKDAFQLNSADEIFETLRQLHSVLVDEYHLMTNEDDDEQPYESSQLNLLIANASGIYEVQGYREVIEYEKFWATGSGFRFALGALDALYSNETLDAMTLARRAVEIGCTFDDASGLPADSHSVELKGK